MVFRAVNSQNSNTSNMAQINDLAREIRAGDRVKIYKDDAGTNRVLLGKGQNGFYGLKVAPENVNVYTATDEELIFNSNQNVFKVVLVGSTTMPTYSVTSTASTWVTSSSGTPPSVTVAHGQSRVPIVFAFLRTTGPGGKTSAVLPYTDFGLIGSNPYFHSISLSVDSTYLSINEVTMTYGSVGTLNHGGGTIDYFILQETSP